jgi:hypothetical protein
MTKKMLSLALCGSVAAGLLVSVPAVEAKPGGCLKYGAAGAIAGHAVHHGVKGFLAGCAAGMYRRHLYNKSVREQKAAPAKPDTDPAPGPDAGGAPAKPM